MLYNLFTFLYPKAIALAAHFNAKAQLAIAGRKDWQKRVGATVVEGDRWLWMHCSSLGEFEQGRPLFEALRKKYPKHKLALSFFSPSGYEVRKNYDLADLVFYHPFDSKENAEQLYALLQPEMLILVKYDYWYYTLEELHRHNVPIFVISALFREEQSFFKSWGHTLREKLKRNVTHFFVQDQDSENLLRRYGIEQVSVAGDTRFDRVKSLAAEAPRIEKIEDWRNSTLVVLGSTWPDDENLWQNVILAMVKEGWQFAMAPHEVSESRLQQIENLLPGLTQRMSGKILDAQPVMLIDSMGMLSSLYGYASLSFVGGGFKKSGVHNTLEPAVFGQAVITGPNIQKFREAREMKELGILFAVKDQVELKQILQKWSDEVSWRDEIASKSQQYFASQPHATEIIMGMISKYIQ